MFREKGNTKPELKVHCVLDDTEKSDHENDAEIENYVSFLKFAIPTEQEADIKEKTIATFEARQNRDNLAIRFPRFLDTNGLVSFIFNLQLYLLLINF